MEYNVAVDLKIYLKNPSSAAVVTSGLVKLVKVQSSREEELGFGIKILRTTVLMDDSLGGMDQLEEKIRSLEDVSEVEIENVTRI